MRPLSKTLNRLEFRSPIGVIEIMENDGAVAELSFRDRPAGAAESAPSPLLKACRTQLEEYFAGTRTVFDVPLVLEGTIFQNEVWTALRNVPYGRTCSYGELARRIGRPAAVRAVGAANGANPVSIIIPCHRIIGGNGSLTGYGGGLWRKKWLISHERRFAPDAGSLFSS